jgi:pimeloyl-ACP methyl ester carboxylesterase
MKKHLRWLAAFSLLLGSCAALSAPALTVLGKDFTFPHKIDGMPGRLSDFASLQIDSFKTTDGVELSYWHAGKGRPLIFIPGWSGNGAHYFNIMYLLSQRYHVYVLDLRNQGLSQRVEYGNRISRHAMDVREFSEHLGLKSADYCGWSMGAAVMWSYIDLFGTRGIRKIAFIDEAPSIYSHADWTEQERLDAGAFTTSPERMIASFASMSAPNQLISATHMFERAMARDSLYFENSEALAQAYITNDIKLMNLVLFDHLTNDWRDVIRTRIDVPTAIFSGEYSDWLQSQRWMQSVIRDATLYVYSKSEQGDHFLAVKNPVKFSSDLQSFLDR